MESGQAQMVFCCAEQWLGGLFYRVEPREDGLRLVGGHTTGCYCMTGVDSGENGFRWGRVVVEAALPPDTALRVYAYASDTRQWGEWADLDAGLKTLEGDPRPWLGELFGPPAAESGDFYLKSRGRYLWLMLELAAAGEQAPEIRSLRLRMGGDHMRDYLPALYQEEDFTYRFLSIFNSMYADMERAIDGLSGQMDYERAEGPLLHYLASWVCIEGGGAAEALRARIRTALRDYEERYTVEGVRRSIRRLTGRDAILLEPFQVSPNRPDCRDPALYRRLYGENPYRVIALLPEQTFSSRQEQENFQREMEELLPAGVTLQAVQLEQCIQLDWHTYLGINSRVGGYTPAVLDEQVSIHYDTTIGGADHESC